MVAASIGQLDVQAQLQAAREGIAQNIRMQLATFPSQAAPPTELPLAGGWTQL